MKLLLIDACPRSRDVSRSYALGAAFRDEFISLHKDAEVEEIRLCDIAMRPLTEGDITSGNAAPDASGLALARQFAAADMIAICAPYWNFLYPALLATYLENICVSGITFTYVNDRPQGLCRAKALAYLTSAGGYIGENDWGFKYIRAMCGQLLGIPAFYRAEAQGLDCDGTDVSAVMAKATEDARAIARMMGKV